MANFTCRLTILGTEVLSIELGHAPGHAPADDDKPDRSITGGASHNFETRGVEDVRDTDGWLPLGFGTRQR